MTKTTAYIEGSPDSAICVLLEAPGGAEMAAHRPVVGPSGKLFDTCCASAGIPRRSIYILNCWPFRVRKKGDTIFAPNGDVLWSSRVGMTADGLDAAQETLARLRECKANIVVPLGATAFSLIHSERQIMKWRGSLLWSDVIGKKILPTPHPAASLRGMYTLRYTIISDLRKAKKHSTTPDLVLRKRTFITDPSFSDCTMYLRDLIKRGVPTSTDIEGLNEQVVCIAFAASAEEAICVPFVDERGHIWPAGQEVEIWRLIAKILADRRIVKIGQNFVFDMAVLLQRNGLHTLGPIYDTMVAQHILYPDFPKGLDFITSLYTDLPYYKDEGKVWKKPYIDWDEFWEYNCKDVVGAYESWDEHLERHLDRARQREHHDFVTSMYPALAYMMVRGVKVDIPNLAITHDRIEIEIAGKEAELAFAWDHEFSVSSPKQCNEYFYGHKGIKPYVSRKTGKPTTDDEALTRIWRRYHFPEAKIAQEIRSLRKLRSSYLEVEIDKDNRLRCSYNPRGTVTGRLSSSQTVWGSGMNMQNVDPRFRGFLVAD